MLFTFSFRKVMTSKFETVEVRDADGNKIDGLINIGGFRMWKGLFSAEEVGNRVNNLVNLPIRDDDIMFCSAPKSGKLLWYPVM